LELLIILQELFMDWNGSLHIKYSAAVCAYGGYFSLKRVLCTRFRSFDVEPGVCTGRVTQKSLLVSRRKGAGHESKYVKFRQYPLFRGRIEVSAIVCPAQCNSVVENIPAAGGAVCTLPDRRQRIRIVVAVKFSISHRRSVSSRRYPHVLAGADRIDR